MPIKHINAPAPSFEELRANMTNVHPDPNDHSPHIPHKVYTMSIEALLSGKRVESAQHIAWRYVFRGDDQEYHVAEISVNEADNSHTFHHVNHGRHIDGFIALYEQIHAHESVLERDYEINLLRVPACYVMAVWFKGADHKHEFLVPLAPVHKKFEAGRHYEADEFWDLLEAAARDVAGSAVDDMGLKSTDDLTRIEGIGPQIAALLMEAGIATFADLALTKPARLEKILSAGGGRFNFSNPTTWPKQANLAALGKWQELQELQDELKGGVQS